MQRKEEELWGKNNAASKFKAVLEEKGFSESEINQILDSYRMM